MIFTASFPVGLIKPNIFEQIKKVFYMTGISFFALIPGYVSHDSCV